jgi:hypothetical protein
MPCVRNTVCLFGMCATLTGREFPNLSLSLWDIPNFSSGTTRTFNPEVLIGGKHECR